VKEAMRYLQNAKEILGKSAIEDGQYWDDKYVKSACGVAYLGVLRAIDQFLLSRGVSKKELPKKMDEYMKALQKHASIHDGKLIKQFDNIYDELHIAGYYRGILHSVPMVKAALKSAEDFIKKISIN
jgi:hypothetical protein